MKINYKLSKENIKSYEVHNKNIFSGCQIKVFGEPLGSFINRKVVDYIKFKTILSEANTVEEIETLSRFSVGDFFLVIESFKGNDFLIISSPGGHGCFYCINENTIDISDIDLPLINQKRDLKLNSQALEFLLYSGKQNPPFDTLFSNVKKLPIGFTFHYVDGKIKIKTHVGTKNKYSYKRTNYKNFKEVIEGQSNVIVEYCKYKNIEVNVMLSGGIDSVISIVSLIGKGAKNKAVTATPKDFFDEFAYEKQIREATNICKKNNIDIKLCEFSYSDEKYKDIFEKVESICYFIPCLIRSACNDYQNEEKKLILCGHRMDRLFSISFTKGDKIPLNSKDSFWKIFERSHYSRAYLSVALNHYSKFFSVFYYYQIIRNRLRFQKNTHEYILNCIKSNFGQCFETKSNNRSVFKNDKFFNSILKKSLTDLEYKSIINNKISPKKFINIIRRISFLMNSFGHNSMYIEQLLCNNNPNLAFGSQGPLADFFYNKTISLKDIYFPKNYYYRYFKEKTGFDYWNLVNENAKTDTERLKIKKVEETIMKWNQSSVFHVIEKDFNPNDNRILDLIDEKTLKSDVQNYFSKLFVKSNFEQKDFIHNMNQSSWKNTILQLNFYLQKYYSTA